MLSLFGFGKRRKVSRKSSKKPSPKLLGICKRYGVKAMSKGKYHSTKSLKKKCLKKVMVLYKKMMKQVKKSHFGVHKARKPMMGRKKAGKGGNKSGMSKCGTAFGAARRRKVSRVAAVPLTLEQAKAKVLAISKLKEANKSHCATLKAIKAEYGADIGIRCKKLLGEVLSKFGKSGFGKRRKVHRKKMTKKAAMKAFKKLHRKDRKKMSKAAAMKAFKKFYKKHSGHKARRARRSTRSSRFGGNPPLYQSMGNEFCSNGSGVLGYNSTGLFPTPCINTVASPMAAFGRRKCRTGYRRARTDKRKCVRTTRRRKAVRKPKSRKSACSLFGAKRRKARKAPTKRRNCSRKSYVEGSPCNLATQAECTDDVFGKFCSWNKATGCRRRARYSENPFYKSHMEAPVVPLSIATEPTTVSATGGNDTELEQAVGGGFGRRLFGIVRPKKHFGRRHM